MQEDEALDLKTIIESLFDVVGYKPSSSPQSWNVDDGHDGVVFASIIKKAVSLVEFCYFNHSFHVKLVFALYCWFFFYIDDSADKLSLEDYQRRLLLRYPQEDPVLEHFHEVLGRLYDHWDPVCANSMTCAALEFLSGTILENRLDISSMTARSSAPNWPKYLREKSGMAPGFSCAVFPASTHTDISAYIQILPDIASYFYLANDILSCVNCFARHVTDTYFVAGQVL
ncbi:putative terpene cyclase [Mycena venus]|uniref:Putative terpene cyclase n=1 Tax=Mycena venus TaxID=2733690 RepID=A0A8H6YJ74_9AGAR|nr:putative terpene cyclase [Mycena venus]